MNTILTRYLLPACVLALTFAVARADEEQTQIAILQSDASLVQKWAACQKLRVIGTVRTVPAVAVLLTDPALSQAARQTLEGLPYPEVDEVLRQALGQTTGLLKAGIVDSIGWRGQPAALPQLIPLLSESDTNVAAAAAAALGRIGGQEALAALSAARDKPPATVQFVVQSSLLQCAERLAASNEDARAIAIYRLLYEDKYPKGIRTAAWRGLVLSDATDAAQLMNQALLGTDRALQQVALEVLREPQARHLLQACFAQWASLPTEAQLALLEAEVKNGPEALPVARRAARSQDVALRVAAWEALGQLNDLASVPQLAQAAAGGASDERAAAADSLARLSGAGAFDALLAEFPRASTPEKVELLRAFGARRDNGATDVLLQNAAGGDTALRLAALQSLQEVAPPQALLPLLEVARNAGSDDIRSLAINALSAVCQASRDKDAATRAVVKAEGNLPAAERAEFLPLLGCLATPEALAVAEASARSGDADLAKEAVRNLAQWPNADPDVFLLDLGRTTTDNDMRVMAQRGAIALSAAAPTVAQRLALLKEAMADARRADVKKQALAQLGEIPTPGALEVALKTMGDAEVANEASVAVLSIAEKLASAHPKLVNEAAATVLARNPRGELFQRAWALRSKPAQSIPFIRDWLICGPYSRPGVTGATAVFKIPFGPEIAGQPVEWKTAPSQDHVNLGAMYPGAVNCAAYLRTSITVPEDCSGVLLMGSDDGIKAWLNGVVVHSHNVNRGEVADQDAAPISLVKGANELILKISQGGGGWSACARIVGTNGQPIEGLHAERPTAANGPLSGGD